LFDFNLSVLLLRSAEVATKVNSLICLSAENPEQIFGVKVTQCLVHERNQQHADDFWIEVDCMERVPMK
jgi:hypothetical protein